MGVSVRTAKNAAADLFGVVPVTWPEVYAWCEAVAGIPADSWRLPYYIEYWNVPAKVAAAKAAGTFEQAIAPRAAAPPQRPRRLAR